MDALTIVFVIAACIGLGGILLLCSIKGSNGRTVPRGKLTHHEHNEAGENPN